MIPKVLLSILLATQGTDTPQPLYLPQGAVAPFAGHLLPGALAAQLLVDAQTCDERIQLTVGATVAAAQIRLESCEAQARIRHGASMERIERWESWHREWAERERNLLDRLDEEAASADFWRKASITGFVGAGVIVAGVLLGVLAD